MSLLQNLTSETSATQSADPRLAALKTWLGTLNVVEVASARPASADASFRRYFRVDVLPEQQAALGPTLIVMDAPPERENVLGFVKLDEMLTHAGVTVPRMRSEPVEVLLPHVQPPSVVPKSGPMPLLRTVYYTLDISTRFLLRTVMGTASVEAADRLLDGYWRRIFSAGNGSLRATGRHHFVPGQPYVLMSNHGSLLDIPDLVHRRAQRYALRQVERHRHRRNELAVIDGDRPGGPLDVGDRCQRHDPPVGRHLTRPQQLSFYLWDRHSPVQGNVHTKCVPPFA